VEASGVSLADGRRRPKGHRAARYRWNLKDPAGRLRNRKARLEDWIDLERFGRELSLELDKVIARLERQA
jgi:hypothetical protein